MERQEVVSHAQWLRMDNGILWNMRQGGLIKPVSYCVFGDLTLKAFLTEFRGEYILTLDKRMDQPITIVPSAEYCPGLLHLWVTHIALTLWELALSGDGGPSHASTT